MTWVSIEVRKSKVWWMCWMSGFEGEGFRREWREEKKSPFGEVREAVKYYQLFSNIDWGCTADTGRYYGPIYRMSTCGFATRFWPIWDIRWSRDTLPNKLWMRRMYVALLDGESLKNINCLPLPGIDITLVRSPNKKHIINVSPPKGNLGEEYMIWLEQPFFQSFYRHFRDKWPQGDPMEIFISVGKS